MYLTHEQHWQELRSRLYLCLIFFIIGFCITGYFAQEIIVVIAKPLLQASHADEKRKILLMGITEGFFVHMRVALYAGIMLSIPIISWQIYRFISPGLYPRERWQAMMLSILSPILFLCGMLLAYFGIMPLAWRFFLAFEHNDQQIPLVLEARMNEYLDSVIEMLLAFGFAFQLPIILSLCASLGLIDSSTLILKRRHAIVLIFIVAALLTPPDVLSQISLAIPLILLYEMSIIIMRFSKKNDQ